MHVPGGVLVEPEQADQEIVIRRLTRPRRPSQTRPAEPVQLRALLDTGLVRAEMSRLRARNGRTRASRPAR